MWELRPLVSAEAYSQEIRHFFSCQCSLNVLLWKAIVETELSVSGRRITSVSALPEPAPQSESDRLDAAADQAIAACGGDLRSAIRSLIIANEFLIHEVEELMVAVSKGYSRGRYRRSAEVTDD